MTGSHRIRRILALLAAACLVAQAVATTPAAADEQPIPPVPRWLPLTCATGELAGHPDAGRAALRLTGWIRPCDPAAPTNGFGLLTYGPSGGTMIDTQTPYLSTPAPTAVDLELDLGSGTQPFALCLAYHPYGRAACVAVDFTVPDRTPVVTPIATNDPRVLVPVTLYGEILPGGHTCGTCV